MVDVDLMFENAKSYNQDESQIFRDAVELQAEAHRLADEERSKPDTEYVMDEGRIPMPNGILHNGELYKVGDWVLIQNANDLTKPIPAQVYRTWQDKENGKWVNVCWYYRPEQTVHRFDKHFLDNEVVKTGQYRDHRVDEIIGRCFIMFTTRYFKGRPRNLPSDMEIFVCEARYNEEKLTFNKIKTWASCLPDEVRDKDYEMSLFDGTRKMRKFPSPIAYLLKDEQKETDDMPKPEWGAENAPPKVGAVHRRLRDPRVSEIFFTCDPCMSLLYSGLAATRTNSITTSSTSTHSSGSSSLTNVCTQQLICVHGQQLPSHGNAISGQTYHRQSHIIYRITSATVFTAAKFTWSESAARHVQSAQHLSTCHTSTNVQPKCSSQRSASIKSDSTTKSIPPSTIIQLSRPTTNRGLRIARRCEQ